MPGESPAQARVKLVVHGGVDVGRDQRVESSSLFSAEPETAAIVAGAPDVEALPGLAGERLVVEDRLALAPACIRASERAVIPVPHGEATGIQPLEHRARGNAAPARPVVFRQ